MINFTEHKIKIAAEDPLNENYITYNKGRWTKYSDNERCFDCIDSYDNKKIGRKEIIDEFRLFFIEEGRSPLSAFLMTMVWGYDSDNRGAFRVNNFLSLSNIKIIESGFKELRDRNLESAFATFNSIKGLGISFISKIMYFAGRASGIKRYSLIFDRRVAQSLISIATCGQLDEVISANPINSFEAYESYNDLLHTWAEELEVDAEKVEYFIFKGGR